MSEQQAQGACGTDGQSTSPAGGVGFLGGFVGAVLFFGFFPGLPHVIDWGAVLVSVGVGVLVRWGVRWWVGR
ncbi:hypothetical protein ACH4UY_23960 [Streptomyces longwoodensis]|uniref:hypothetical protein n=1 Tax=Streptomyces longwoodensis TaxID=68231 RepID=UPI0037A87492